MKAIVLAAGKGVRMRSDLPKVVHQLNGKPLVSYVVDNLKEAGVDDVIVIVGYKSHIVKEKLGDSVLYANQEEQLGTGHAVLQAVSVLTEYEGNVIVACGDAPFVSSNSFKLLQNEIESNEKIKGVVLTAEYENPFGYGRIITDLDGFVERIVEEKDASENEKKVNIINTGTYIFDSKILFEALKNIGTDNAQNEYYLPDVVKYINNKGYIFSSVKLENNNEGIGINTKEELDKAAELISK